MHTDGAIVLMLLGLAAVLALQIALFVRGRSNGHLDQTLRAESLANRNELSDNLLRLQKAIGEQITNIAKLQNDQLTRLAEVNERKLTEVRATLEVKLKDLQTDNAAKLEEMRRTVDEKLHQTLEKRLG